MNSRIPIFGLVNAADVIRKKETDDGFGGVALGAIKVIYSQRKCRITTMSDEDEYKGYGMATGLRWKVLMELSKNVQRSDFIRCPWGTFPNIEGAGGLEDGFPPQVVIDTPDGNKTLVWFADPISGVARYSDLNASNEPNDAYIVFWNGTAWVFTDTGAYLTVPFTVEQHHNLFNLDWADLVGAGYEVLSQTGVTKDYRIVYVKHQIDDFGKEHHTTIVMTSEEEDR